MEFHRLLSPFAKFGALACIAATAFGQAQPQIADNNQDEQINFDRAIDASTDRFKILRSQDKQEINQYVTKVYPLTYANPFEIYPYIKSIVNLERGTVATAQNMGPDGYLRRWIQVNVPSFLIPSLDQAIAAYDVPDFISAPGFVAFAYRTQHRNAKEVADFIQAATLLTPDTKVVADPFTNTLYFQESPSDFKRVFGSILFTDIPQPEIDLEVTIIELTRVDDNQLGLDWDAWKSLMGGKLTGNLKSSRISGSDGVPDIAGHSQAWEGTVSLGATTLAEFLNYLVDQGKAEVLCRTNLTLQNGRVGRLESTTDISNVDYTAAPNGEGLYNKEEKSRTFEGVVLDIKPSVAMRSANMEVLATLRSPVGFNAADNVIFSEQEVRTNLTLEDGQLGRIAGLRRGVVTTKSSGFWGLKSIPYLKYFFSTESNIIRESEVIVMLRPRWSAPELPDASWKDFHRLVEAFEIDDLLKTNPNLHMSAEDAETLRRYYADVSKP